MCAGNGCRMGGRDDCQGRCPDCGAGACDSATGRCVCHAVRWDPAANCSACADGYYGDQGWALLHPIAVDFLLIPYTVEFSNAVESKLTSVID